MTARTNLFGRAVGYVTSAVSELRKVVWPTRQEVINHTVTILIVSIISMIILGLLDYGLTSLLRLVVVG